MSVSAFYRHILENDYQRQNEWEFNLDDPEFGNLSYQVKSVDLPFLQLKVETSAIGTKFYTGYDVESDLTLEIYESAKFSAWKYFYNWFNSIFDMNQRVFKKGTMLGRDGSLTFHASGQNLKKRFLLQNMRIVSVRDKSLEYASGDALTFSYTFAVDRVIPQDILVEQEQEVEVTGPVITSIPGRSLTPPTTPPPAGATTPPPAGATTPPPAGATTPPPAGGSS